ncbi:helix-turn-helix domain-containing protein [Paenibacillus sp. RUD330]|nr:helix-turn-helix domain-containing protein [Paenibacillus sp. RUD330]
MKKARLIAGLTQQETADLLNVHRQTYIKWEKDPDNMPVGQAKKFSESVNLNVDEIFFGVESTLSRIS